MPQGPAVTRLIEAGALILGKTVTTEFAYFDTGATTNPHNPLHTPGGSSSGSGAAVASGYVPLAIGSQTVGSVLRPASFVGVVGYKGTYDRVGTDGAVTYSKSVDHVGWFTHDVAGARLVASVMYEDWRADAVASTGLPVVGVPVGPYIAQATPAARDLFEATIAALEARGVPIRRVPLLEDIERINVRHRTLANVEFGDAHAERFTRWGSLYRSGSAAYFDAAQRITPEQRAEGLAGIVELRQRVETTMDREGIDVWASLPALGTAPLGLNSTGDPVMNTPWTHTGQPAIAIPMGMIEQLPMGLQLSGRFGADEEFLAAAEAIESLLRS